MEALNETKISDIGKCSGVLWKTFKELCTAAESIPEREKVIDMAFIIFRDKVMEYRNTDLYSYAVEYSHARRSSAYYIPAKSKRATIRTQSG